MDPRGANARGAGLRRGPRRARGHGVAGRLSRAGQQCRGVAAEARGRRSPHPAGTARTAAAARQPLRSLWRRLPLRSWRTVQRPTLAGRLPHALAGRHGVGASARHARPCPSATRRRGAGLRRRALLLRDGRLCPRCRRSATLRAHRRPPLRRRLPHLARHRPHAAPRPARGAHAGGSRGPALGLCPHRLCRRRQPCHLRRGPAAPAAHRLAPRPAPKCRRGQLALHART